MYLRPKVLEYLNIHAHPKLKLKAWYKKTAFLLVASPSSLVQWIPLPCPWQCPWVPGLHWAHCHHHGLYSWTAVHFTAVYSCSGVHLYWSVHSTVGCCTLYSTPQLFRCTLVLHCKLLALHFCLTFVIVLKAIAQLLKDKDSADNCLIAFHWLGPRCN